MRSIVVPVEDTRLGDFNEMAVMGHRSVCRPLRDQLHFRYATLEMHVEESRQSCVVDLVRLGIGSFILTFLESLAEDAFLGEEPLDKVVPVL